MTSHSQPVGAPEMVDLSEVERIAHRWISAPPHDTPFDLPHFTSLMEIVRGNLVKPSAPMPQDIADAISLVRDYMISHYPVNNKDQSGFMDSVESLLVILESSTQRLALMESQLPRVWQPIETAPRDGTRILIFGKGGGDEGSICIGRFDKMNGFTTPSGFGILDTATMWMELPPPPIEGQVR